MVKFYYEFFCFVKVIVGYVVLEYILFELVILGVIWFLIIIDKGVCVNNLLVFIEVVFEFIDVVIGVIFDDVLFDLSLEIVCKVVNLYCEY